MVFNPPFGAAAKRLALVQRVQSIVYEWEVYCPRNLGLFKESIWQTQLSSATIAEFRISNRDGPTRVIS
jgi:hypothetical protein